MPRVLPSDVVEIIHRDFSEAATSGPSGSYSPTVVDRPQAPDIAALAALLDRLPEDVLCPLGSKEYRDLVSGITKLRQFAHMLSQGQPVFFEQLRATVSCILVTLKKCRDEGIEPSTAGLEFIKDDELRQSVRLDISSSQTALNSGEWKAATVLAGSALEALLLWAVMQHGETERESAVSKAARKVNHAHPEDWHLSDYVEVARALGHIGEGAGSQARLAKDFRNLIHPGREQRTQTRCDRGTAHAVFAALHLVISDFEKSAKSSL